MILRITSTGNQTAAETRVAVHDKPLYTSMGWVRSSIPYRKTRGSYKGGVMAVVFWEVVKFGSSYPSTKLHGVTPHNTGIFVSFIGVDIYCKWGMR
jgi:hypothetical protein